MDKALQDIQEFFDVYGPQIYNEATLNKIGRLIKDVKTSTGAKQLRLSKKLTILVLVTRTKLEELEQLALAG